MTNENRPYYSVEAMTRIKREFETVTPKYEQLLMAFHGRKYRNERAHEFALHGVARRARLLARSVHNVFRLIPPNTNSIPSDDDRLDATINIQNFILNVFGSIDNLAWAWVEEKEIRKQNGNPLSKFEVGFSQKCEIVRGSLSPEFQEYVSSETLARWFDGMTDYRDGIAHRIPIYIPPFTVDEKEYEVLEQRKQEAAKVGAFDDLQKITNEQLKLPPRFVPWIQPSFSEKRPPIVIHPQLLSDFNLVHELGMKVFKELSR